MTYKGYKQTDEHIHKKAEGRKRGAWFDCLVCSKPFWRNPRAIKDGNNKFCSKLCYFVWQRGRKRSPEFAEKCRIGQRKRNAIRILITPINIRIRNGDKTKAWRWAVYIRDNFTCQKCKDRTRKGHYVKLEAHHIKPFATYPELRFDVNNGLTLCKKCHSKEPKGREIYAK